MAEKHKRNFTESLSEQEVSDTLEVVQNTLLSLEPKQQHILAEWLEVWSKYLGYEKTFKPQN